MKYDIDGLSRRDAKKILRGRYYFSAKYNSELDKVLSGKRIYNKIDFGRGTIITNKIIDDDLNKTFNTLLGAGMDLVRMNALGFKRIVGAKQLGKMRYLMNNGKHDDMKSLFIDSIDEI